MAITERALTVLSQVITLHYHTCEPVGSALISKTKFLPYSPATIRSVMMRLEMQGYLVQPHISAGRLPTDLGYRTYVNQIRLKSHFLSEPDRVALSSRITASSSAPGALEAIADYIHRRTNLLTFYIPFRESGVKLKHIHFERLDPERLLALWVAKGGHTFHAILQIPESALCEVMLEKVGHFFNSSFRGCNLIEIQQRLNQRVTVAPDEWDLLLNKVTLIADRLTREVAHLGKIPFMGASSMLKMPEFQEIEVLQLVFDLLDKQTKLQKLVRGALKTLDDLTIFFIGGEMNDPDLDHFSLALAKIKNFDDWLGCIGVLGPKRMPYLDSLQMLSFAKENMAKQTF